MSESTPKEIEQAYINNVAIAWATARVNNDTQGMVGIIANLRENGFEDTAAQYEAIMQQNI